MDQTRGRWLEGDLLMPRTFRPSRRGALALLVAGLLLGCPRGAIAANRTLLVFGDSLVAGLGLSDADGFVARMQQALDQAKAGVTLVNGGVSGDTTGTALDRLDWALGDAPEAVLLELGANDMLQGLPVANVAANLDAIMQKLKAANLPVFITGMQANRGLGADYATAFDALYPALAAKYRAALYPFYLDGVALDPKLNQADGIHPNAAGVAVIVARMLPALKTWLGKLG
jgi:acyl-CoA thioesterase-1